MTKADTRKHIAIIGGGPAGLFMMKQLVRSGRKDLHITIFESRERLGEGMPYSSTGANGEHVTNVSENEVPELETTVSDWMETQLAAELETFDIDLPRFHAWKVLPRLLFGTYLSDQFELLLRQAAAAGIETQVLLRTPVEDIANVPGSGQVAVTPKDADILYFDYLVMATGHHWPRQNEGRIPGWFDSPYPPVKLEFEADHPVCIKGASLTAIDALKTLARSNGRFLYRKEKLVFELSEKSPSFRLVLHSRSGLLPAVRFHLDNPGTASVTVVSQEEISAIRVENEGFVPLDLIFERNFKDLFREKDPELYARIRDWDMEAFVSGIMDMRERMDAFQLFKAEFVEAEKSISRRQSIHWKELLSELSFAMNYPAKYFSAEDMLRLQKALMPLISVIIASVPQSSAREMIALHEAGVLELKAVGADNTFEPTPGGGTIVKYTDEEGKQQVEQYHTFIDCSGQRHFPYAEFPFKSLRNDRSISPARLKFRTSENALKVLEEDASRVEEGSGDYFLKVPGIMINDYFQVLDQYGALNERIYILAVPYIGGYNPDYSGLDFCEAASERVIEGMKQSWEQEN
jgi:uncharacterized NAD(P)/FAD-binding protein YdhS